MNSTTIVGKFYLLTDERQQHYYDAALALSHIFTLNSQKFKKLQAKIDNGSHPLLSVYKFGSDQRHFLEFAMLCVLKTGKLTGLQASRIAYLCDGDTSKQVKDKSNNRTFERSNVTKGGNIETHKMGLTSNLLPSKTLSRKVKVYNRDNIKK